MDLDRPVFMVGMPRSGTTIIYEALARHEDLGWFSSFVVRQPRMEFLTLLSRIYDLPLVSQHVHGVKPQFRQGRNLYNKFLPKPDEGWSIWRRLCGEHFLYEYLLDVKATPRERTRTHRGISRLLRYQGKQRFLSKTVGPPRMEYLQSIFPDAFFIQIVRDGRAVVNSLLNFSVWKEQGGYEKPFWDKGLPDDWMLEWERSGKSPAALAAIQWRVVQDVSQDEASRLRKGRFMLVRYEDFTADPVSMIREIQDFCGLSRSHRVESSMEKPGSFVDMNYKFRKAFSQKEIEALEGLMEPWLSRYGYLEMT